MIKTKELVWKNLSEINTAPSALKPWLDDDQSLTAKLKHKFSDFSVRVISQVTDIPYENELDALEFNNECVIREVELLGNGQVVVFARSVIPVNQDTQDLLAIGSKPLGEILFNNPEIQRGELQITHTETTWGRRSVFCVGNTPLLVSEFFMENLYVS